MVLTQTLIKLQLCRRRALIESIISTQIELLFFSLQKIKRKREHLFVKRKPDYFTCTLSEMVE